MVTDFAQVTTQRSVSNRSRKPCSTQLRCSCQDDTRGVPYLTESSKTSCMMAIGAIGDDDMCGRGQANVEYIVMDERRDPRLEEA